MIKTNFSLLQILTNNSLNGKHQGKSSNHLAFHLSVTRILKTLKSNNSEAYKAQVDCLKDSEPDSHYKNGMKEKVNVLVKLHEAMQEELKTASYSEQIQIPEK